MGSLTRPSAKTTIYKRQSTKCMLWVLTCFDAISNSTHITISNSQCNFNLKLKYTVSKLILSWKDSDGCGAEVVGPRDAPLSFVLRLRSTSFNLQIFEERRCLVFFFLCWEYFLGKESINLETKQCKICNSNRESPWISNLDLRAAHVAREEPVQSPASIDVEESLPSFAVEQCHDLQGLSIDLSSSRY